MTEISLCSDSQCPSREKCKRFTAAPAKLWQSWLPRMREKGWDRCGYFVANETEKIREMAE